VLFSFKLIQHYRKENYFNQHYDVTSSLNCETSHDKWELLLMSVTWVVNCLLLYFRVFHNTHPVLFYIITCNPVHSGLRTHSLNNRYTWNQVLHSTNEAHCLFATLFKHAFTTKNGEWKANLNICCKYMKHRRITKINSTNIFRNQRTIWRPWHTKQTCLVLLSVVYIYKFCSSFFCFWLLE